LGWDRPVALERCRRLQDLPVWSPLLSEDMLHSRHVINRIFFSVVNLPKGDWKAEDVAPVGELLLDISINLAKT